MFEFQQFFLVILISTLTILVVIFSIYVFRILAELRETLRKVNKMLDDMGSITGSIAKPISGLSDMVSGLKSGVRVFDVIGKFVGKRHQDDDDDESSEEEEEETDE